MPVIYGIHPVREALRGGEVERVIIQKDSRNQRLGEIVTLARDLAVDVRFEPRSRLDHLTEQAVHQGVVAFVAGRRLLSLEEVMAGGGESPLYLLIDGVEDPHNLGAIIRSADGAGVTGIILPKRRTAPLSDTVWKASAGAVQHVPVARVANLHQTIGIMKKAGVWVVGADVAGECQWHEADYHGPTALVVGREGEGLHRLVRESCDQLVRLPMKGVVQSLNVSVSTGILLYEVLRQRSLAR